MTVNRNLRGAAERHSEQYLGIGVRIEDDVLCTATARAC